MPTPRLGTLFAVGMWTGGAVVVAQICITLALLAALAATIGKVMLVMLFLVVGVVTGCTAVVTPVFVAVVLLVGFASNFGKAIGEAIGAAFEQVAIQLGPESEQWPVQPTDARTAALLQLGRQTAARRTSLDLELTGGYVDSFVYGEKVRVRVRWRTPNLYRIDVTGEWIDETGKKSPFQRSYLRASDDQFAFFNPDAKRLDLFQDKNGKEVLDAFNILRWEPLPWFFPNVHDVIQKRWKIEQAGADAESVQLQLTPAHERWPMSGTVWLDPQSGMPKRLMFTKGLLGAAGNVNVERLVENSPLADDLFQPIAPVDWEVKHHGLAKDDDANEAARILFRTDRQVAAVGSKHDGP